MDGALINGLLLAVGIIVGAAGGAWWERKHPLTQLQADIAAIKRALTEK